MRSVVIDSMLLSLICGVNYFGCCLSTQVSFPFFYNSTLTIPFEGCRLLFTGPCVCVCVRQEDMINTLRNQETREALFHWEVYCHPQLFLSHSSSLLSQKAWHVLSQVLYKVLDLRGMSPWRKISHLSIKVLLH